jgi:hypothetical protein
MKTLILAYATGGPPSPDLQIQLCVYAPALTIVLSWLLIRWKRKLVWGAVVLAIADALVVLLSFEEYLDSIMWLYPVKPWSLIAAPWIATAMPCLVIWKIWKEPNQRPESNAGMPPPSSGKSPAVEHRLPGVSQP